MEIKLCPLSLFLLSAVTLGETIYLFVNIVLGNFSGAMTSFLYFAAALLVITLLSYVFC